MTLFRYVFIFVICGPPIAFAKPLRIVTFPIPLMVENERAGVFIELTNEIAKRNNLTVSIEVSPPGKSILAFSSGKADGFFPAWGSSIPKKTSRSLSFYEKADYVFYKKGKSCSKIVDLEGKKVGLTFRYPYTKELLDNKKIHFQFAEDDVANMQKLAKGDIDAFVVEEKSGLKALELSGVSEVEYKNDTPLSRQEVYYAFQDNDEGRRLAQVFSKTILKMKNDGGFKKIMSNHRPKPSL